MIDLSLSTRTSNRIFAAKNTRFGKEYPNGGRLTSAAPLHIIDHTHRKGASQVDLDRYIRDIPDFPAPGILFRDITPLLENPDAFRYAVDRMAQRFSAISFDLIVSIESRGFVFGAPMAYSLGVPLVPARKPGKLPSETLSVTYALEYGSDSMEIHVDAIGEGQRALIVDDLLATGGTMSATAQLVERAGGSVVGCAVVVELSALGGRDALAGRRVESLLIY